MKCKIHTKQKYKIQNKNMSTYFKKKMKIFAHVTDKKTRE